MQSRKLNKLSYLFEFGPKEQIEFVLMSDIHEDNPKCDRAYFLKHLSDIQKKGGKAFIFGDLFCFMQGKYDPRRSKSDIRPEHNVPNYIDAVIDEAVELLKPFADTIAFVSEGNHETAILKNLETDVLSRFVDKFNALTGAKVIKGGYRGWVVLRKNHASRCSSDFKIYYHHGYGGGGEMSKGILQHSRMNMHIEGADAIVMGHVHESYIVHTKTESFSNSAKGFGNVKTRLVYNIRTLCYKDEFIEGGFHIEKGRPPKPLGCVYGRIDVERTKVSEGNGRVLIPLFTTWLK